MKQATAQITIDAAHKPYGRVATETALRLRGKTVPSYNSSVLPNIIVTIKNIEQVHFSGKKTEQKIYWKHTKYMGNLKETRLADAFAKSPQKTFTNTVRKMLPANKHRAILLRNLRFE